MTNGANGVVLPEQSVRRTNPDFESVEVGTAERTSRVRDDFRGKKSQASALGRRVDDDHQGISFDSGDPEAFRSGQVEVAFERLFATPELVRTPYQRSEDGSIIGDDGTNRLPWTGVF